MRPPTTKLAIAASLGVLFFLQPALAQDGSLLTTLENEVADAAQGWETTVMQAARSLFWILAGIEVGIAAVWLALGAASLDTWFAELVRRIMFIGLFVFILEQGPDFARAMVDSLFQIGAGGGSASPANVFNAGLQVASQMSEKAQFGLFEDNALAIAAVFAMVIVVIAFSLVAAIFVAVMAEMYVGLLAGMIMLGLGGSSFTKDFAVRYLVYAFSVGMKLMALVMIARIGSEVLINLANSPSGADEFLSTLAIGGISVVVFVIAMYVPNIVQGVVQGVSVTGGMETIRHGGQAATMAAGSAALAWGGARAGASAYSDARAAGSSFGAAALTGMTSGATAAGSALASAGRDKAIGVPGTWGASTLGLANSKLDQSQGRPTTRKSADDKA
ncbi:P-type conjugative transfer protein TrbL (plasmid) [Nitratireductor rhodophyticola]|jgi:type IV secretion system protein TrbL|uniref:P-type conjugative transfer protein TrbL n=1 Tax=Nitratireductor rhodophyticola TaxID=2854036 RepID=A0ABS7RD94_9HYPH|nr:P-type conjugative transfer protein TrbL [Nitratireductor rhodophyticola]MBO6727980.1 P-type conjugative transfer protein TrbL [Rhizobiaceae bacterium]MBY8918882.1 P-type conjugative transfer protein TrbL [Nitratireductor rhodophyticola]MEC9244389.1 P-type conjugative transfer protein TrbL [Pseudomonadota bacterium]MBY8923063.1 P-type conjugative transfer protein TrbL [Nitratireductor rhodophyticola]WPZ16320.1 P-type conjugative transfer protein TrbL [Nitratireductor rhodophyticola]